MPENDWEHDLIGQLSAEDRADFDRVVAEIQAAHADERRTARLRKMTERCAP